MILLSHDIAKILFASSAYPDFPANSASTFWGALATNTSSRMNRVLPYWHEEIAPMNLAGNNVVIAATKIACVLW